MKNMFNIFKKTTSNDNSKNDVSLVTVAMQFARLRFPDEETPFDPRSVFPPGEMDKGTNYKCLQILVATAFQKGFEYRILHQDEKNPTQACIDYAKKWEDDHKFNSLMKWSFASGIICFDDKEISVRGKTLKIDFNKNAITKKISKV